MRYEGKDVYKRQEVYKENGQVYTGTTMKYAITASSGIVKVEFVKDEVAVSYTHLDVYKRQV